MKAADKLRADWSRREHDVMLHFPIGFSTNTDAHFLSGVFDKEFIAEMTARGYDMTTMRFEISPRRGNPKFRSQRPEESSAAAAPPATPTP